MNEHIPDSSMLDCPFCKGKARVQYNVPLVKCSECGAFANIDVWNARPIQESLWWHPAVKNYRNLMSYYVMLNMQDRVPSLLMRQDRYNNDHVALFRSKRAAVKAAETNIVGSSCGYTIYLWDYPVDPEYLKEPA